VYAGRVLSLRVDTVRLPGGGLSNREIVDHADAVAIVALDSDWQDLPGAEGTPATSASVLLVRQYRKAIDQSLLEIPAGGVEPGETPQQAVVRELQEETGHRPSMVRHLASFYSTPGFCTELMHLYLATGLEPSRLPGDSDEQIEVVRLPWGEISTAIADGKIRDAKSLVGLLLAQRVVGDQPAAGQLAPMGGES
jgi:ADP-ribose pyrophosphatase